MQNKKDELVLSKTRESHHLKLKDIAYLLDINPSNLSRFETGKISSPKALVGYHILFNLSIRTTIRQVFINGYTEIIHRCFQLLERLSEEQSTTKNRLRMKGLNLLIERLTQLEENHDC